MNAVGQWKSGSRAAAASAQRMDTSSVPRPPFAKRHTTASIARIGSVQTSGTPLMGACSASRGSPGVQDRRFTAEWEPSVPSTMEQELCSPVESTDGTSILPRAVEEARHATNEKHATMMKQIKELGTQTFTVLTLQTEHSIRECTNTVGECLLELGVDRTHKVLRELRRVEDCIQTATMKLGKVMEIFAQEQRAVQQLFTLMGSAFQTQHIRRHTSEEEMRAMTAAWDRKDAALDQAVSYVLAVINEHTNWQVQQQQQQQQLMGTSQMEAPPRPDSFSPPRVASGGGKGSSKAGRPPSGPQMQNRGTGSVSVMRNSVLSASGFNESNAVRSGRPGSAKASMANASLLLPVVGHDFIGKCHGALHSLYSAKTISCEERSGNGCMAQFIPANFSSRPQSASVSPHRFSLQGGSRLSMSSGQLNTAGGRHGSVDGRSGSQTLLDCSCAEEGTDVLKSSVVAARWARKAQMQMLSVTPAARLRYVPPMEELEVLRDVLSMGTCSSALLYDVERAQGQLATDKRRVRADCERLKERVQSMRTDLSQMRSWLTKLRDAGKPFMSNKDELMRALRSFVNHQVQNAVKARASQASDTFTAANLVRESITNAAETTAAAPDEA